MPRLQLPDRLSRIDDVDALMAAQGQQMHAISREDHSSARTAVACRLHTGHLRPKGKLTEYIYLNSKRVAQKETAR
ncbi:MAG: hypothetical protein M9929_15590 [Burkholderiaceae bacterium]|nr:hypothetical protein [Burkholderiaceae bacterium]